MGWAGPDGVEYGVEKLTALRWSEAGLGGVPRLGIEARSCEGLEGALRLSCEDGCAAMEWPGGVGDSAEVWKEI